LPRDSQEYHGRVDFAGELGPQRALDKVDVAIQLVFKQARFNSPLFARSHPHKFVTIWFPARNNGQNLADASYRGKILPEAEIRWLEWVGRVVNFL
jgi:hypothetical protein